MQFIKRSFEHFLFFADCFDDNIGRGGGHPNGRDHVRTRKVLSDMVTIVGGRQTYF